MVDHRSLTPLTPAERIRLDEYCQRLKSNPDVQETLRRHWMAWKRGRIIAPGCLDDKLERAYYEGVDQGIQVALGAVAFMERLMADDAADDASED